ncbi:MAG TPA: hypothetical protein VG323_09930 [Thermoanaerobaculia bacterium]|nr:hypothetical protein [Thermoanaerobaculia bacterium]
MRITLATAAFAIALLLRLSNAATWQLAPVDELYHLKRMTHFVEFDPDRRAFCPWPPLYDRLLGGFAHRSNQSEVLARVKWIPPIGGALFVAFAVAWIDRRFGRAAAVAAGAALAASPFIVTQSWVGSIDHHWTEPIFVFAILVGVLERRVWLLAIALTAAMFVQTALLIAAALAFVILFFTTDGREGAIAFGIGAVAITLYRVTRPPGYPDNAWFLGWTHAALFAGAAVACAYLAWRGSRVFALLAGACVVLATPTAPASLLGGSHFFGGERWLQTISEFQPLWRAHGDDLLSIAAGLGAGAILVWPLLRREWRVAAFAILYLLLTITSRRFWSVSIPMLAVAGAVEASRRNRLLLAAVALIPPIQFALWMLYPQPPAASAYTAWFAAARFLHEQPSGGRVLAPWSVGHLIDVVGGRAVVVDNFGTMPDEIAFERAHDAMLTTHEESLARYCDENGVRFVAYDPPRAFASATAIVGVDFPPKLAASTVWLRASRGAPLRMFRRVWAEDGIVIVERR